MTSAARAGGHGHAMPFGAELGPDGVRFRLWAPAASKVELHVEGIGRRSIPLTAVGDGWFAATVAEARPGSLYRYRLDDRAVVPDPASRCQPQDVHGPSAVVDPAAHVWRDGAWRGRPWHEAVIYELHVGAFTPEGTFEGVRRRLEHLAALGITAVELMPIADFVGRRNWGYDGVLPFAPDCAYGTPEDLKTLIDAAHGLGLMMFLDVVYNHFGPEGNFLAVYAPQFFTDRVATPWGAAIDFARREVRDFVIHNALYWLDEYRFDGLRLDAVHAIFDEGKPDILEELAETVQRRFDGERHVHLVLENERNAARYLARRPEGGPRFYTAQWNDDIHHAAHVLATGEDRGYYRDFADRPVEHLGRCLAEGFAYQGEPSAHADGRPRGEPSGHLPPAAFISFLQNHDQVGNRAFGERLTVLAEPHVLSALAAVLLLAPAPPLLFMGEEWGATEPFLFFCDFHDALAEAVRRGRRSEFARFPEFQDPAVRGRIPDPNAEATFAASKLDWRRAETAPHAARLAETRALIALRRREIVPRLERMDENANNARRFGAGGLEVRWRMGDGARLTLVANLSGEAAADAPPPPDGRVLHAVGGDVTGALAQGTLPPWCVAWFLDASP